ncbi:sugar phosphate isomerase/epimerase family protein [Paenibacillus radicis (ex Xue et al. 2023)]|uniref:Sugar phosphate isomerase/epimerase n=1 Tax=Paenibacillus radicis (ex Xue et al. 2023) TaxID=2972489 RepID=A0ABT1YLJ0_9BACL|nr:sugar phosphate isomerase/epimerase family protein [Paenibacillus radicis (ex Xue et al. 2023)]MCR8634053.1 sugar phosphate isomerase/epimerase [Paenibacillus radicis (ex Xue et al. 2023)]
MLKGLTRAGLGSNVGNIEQFIEAAAAHGFVAVAASGQELEEWIAAKGIEAVRGFLQEHGVQIGTIGLSVQWRETEEEFVRGLARLAKDAEAAAAVGCTACVTYVLPSTDQDAAHFTVLATRRLRTCAQILAPYGIQFGLEFVGPHHLRTRWKNPFIWGLQETLDWIDAIGESNVGLLFDSYHWYTNELGVEDILRLKASQITLVHINDAPDVPVADVLDNNRLFPGEGVIDLAGFLRALKQIGYTRVVAQEILTPKPLEQPTEELLQRSRDAFRNVYAAAGLE